MSQNKQYQQLHQEYLKLKSQNEEYYNVIKKCSQIYSKVKGDIVNQVILII